jgi:cleavage stimulation factor subunit 3
MRTVSRSLLPARRLLIDLSPDARALFERVIKTFKPQEAKPIWERWSRSQYQYDDLEAVLELERRMAEVYPNGASPSFPIPLYRLVRRASTILPLSFLLAPDVLAFKSVNSSFRAHAVISSLPPPSLFLALSSSPSSNSPSPSVFRIHVAFYGFQARDP